MFTQDYPVLKAAKNSKNKSMGYLENITGQTPTLIKVNKEEVVTFLVDK